MSIITIILHLSFNNVLMDSNVLFFSYNYNEDRENMTDYFLGLYILSTSICIVCFDVVSTYTTQMLSLFKLM